MKSERLITKPGQYALVYGKGDTLVSNLLVMRYLPNGLSLSRYGISVSRRVGKAVVRNRVRRRFREVLRQALLRPGWDIVFIARPAAATADYAAIRELAMRFLSQAKLLAEQQHEEICLSVN